MIIVGECKLQECFCVAVKCHAIFSGVLFWYMF